ncbi:MAG: hypothetical protein J5I93_03635 [Pirellulaceae bacterium]|nr:hypothetical protein [Pirellulaceae bacterium]
MSRFPLVRVAMALVTVLGANTWTLGQTDSAATRQDESPRLLAPALPAGHSANSPAKTPRLVVHEWGTFTSLQDEQGRSLPGINSDDEPVPGFVHRLADELVIPPSQLAPVYYKGAPRVHRDIVMRLETPVIYFYLPAGMHEPSTLDVRVRFRGGWLTEYYPQARVDAPGLRKGQFLFGRILPETEGRLEWDGLMIGGAPTLPDTEAHVWLAPRQTEATPVSTPAGEAEKYLFYRGVGNLAAPLLVRREPCQDRLTISEQFSPDLFANRAEPRLSTKLWLVDIREDAAVAFRCLGEHLLTGRPQAIVTETAASFAEQDYAPDNLARLRSVMHEALVADGLYSDESSALLSTWEQGYFKSVGMRLFFLLPQAWTDSILPLELSVPADIRRTMVGRIELVTPRHRQLLRRIANSQEEFNISWFDQSLRQAAGSPPDMRAIWEGKLSLARAGVKPPDYYQAYVELGRFRGALLLDAAARTSDPRLAEFAETYRLSYYVR